MRGGGALLPSARSDSSHQQPAGSTREKPECDPRERGRWMRGKMCEIPCEFVAVVSGMGPQECGGDQKREEESDTASDRDIHGVQR